MDAREKELTEIKARVLALRIKPGEIFTASLAEELGLVPGDWLKVGAVQVALQRGYESVLTLITLGEPHQVTELVRSHCASVLGRIEAVNGWAEASREFFAAYDDCCHKCKNKKRVEAARAALHPVVRGG